MLQLLRCYGFPAYILMVFFNAFVDLGHKIIIQNTIFKVYEAQQQIILTAIVNGLILLPFIMVISPAGYCSDKYPKNKVMRVSAWVAVGVTLLITLFYYLGWFWWAFAMTFILALQSAFYSPAKYGYIKELVGKENLAGANGLVQTATTVAILSGIFVFSILFELRLAGTTHTDTASLLSGIYPIGWGLVGCSLIELALAYKVPQRQATDQSMRFDWRKYLRNQYFTANFKVVLNHEIILLSIIGLAIFWSVSQVVLAAFPAHAKATMLITNTVIIQGMIACAGFGIMLGSLIAGRVSSTHIETGLIPVGSVGIAVCLLILPELNHVAAQAVNFLAWGMLGGMLIIPLNALIQFHAGEDQLGRVLAGSNFIQNLVMLSFLGVTIAFALLGIDSYGLFAILVIVAAGGSLYTVYKLPQSLIRFIIAHIIGYKYRLEVLGLNNLPETGGVLMLGNHISWLDWAVIQMASPRPIRFVMLRSIYERWYLRWFLNIFKVIPISAGASRAALKAINTVLNEGGVVCLFPEGMISRTGQMTGFYRGFEKAGKDTGAVILPFYLHGFWGSRFSYSSAALRNARSGGVKRDIIVAFGAALPIDSAAATVKQRVFDLSIDSWQHYSRGLQAIAAAFIDASKRNLNELALVDPETGPLTRGRLLAAVIGLSRRIQRHSPETNIGLLLPTGSAGAVANMAVLMGGKTAVNLNYGAGGEALRAAVAKAEIKTLYTSRAQVQKLSDKGIEPGEILPDVRILYMEDLQRQTGGRIRSAMLLLITLLPSWLLKLLCCKSVSIEQPAVILFSSGSEGQPKGVMLSHKNIMVNIKQTSDVLNTRDGDVVMAALPLFHAFGLTVTILMPLVEGIPTVCHPDPTDTLTIARTIARYRATILFATSTFLRLYSNNKRVHPLMLDSLRLVVAGAEKLSAEVHKAFKLKFNKDVYEGYGTTETAPVASVNIPDTLDVNYWRLQPGNKPGSVGMPLPGCSFRIVDPESLAALAVAEDGLILIGGPQLMLGYVQDQPQTDAVIIELDGRRWYKTGDQGHLDNDGFLSVVDRYSRMANLGGEMISLAEVEERVRAALKQPGLELAALSLADDKQGEKIVLILTEEYAPETIRKAMLAMGGNPLMIPAEIKTVAELPKLASGKTDLIAARGLLSSH